MGATTIASVSGGSADAQWERWDSMLPDGTINPGQMTSFNHYAYGSVATFMFTKMGGLSCLEPGWRKALIKPLPGGTVTSSSVRYDSPYGPYEVGWNLIGDRLFVDAAVPPNASADVKLPGGIVETVGSGRYHWETTWSEPAWPPKAIAGPTRLQKADEYVA